MNAVKLSKIAELTGNRPDLFRNDITVTSICRDSRKARPGAAFFCIVGALSDGHDYALAAYERGCRVFVCERQPAGFPIRGTKVIICKGMTTRAALADVAAEFYGHPERRMRLIGITGTKGKTTTACTVYSIFNECGIPTGYIGTNGVRFADYSHETVNTTPESCDLYEYFSMMLEVGVDTAVIEVSSQALKTGRVRGLTFDTCVFTNLYPDHIGGFEHADMDEYRACKKLLFSEHCGRYAVMNEDSPETNDFASVLRKGIVKVGYGIDRNAHFRGEDIKLCRDEKGLGTEFTCRTSTASLPARIKFPGRFSVSNALAALAVCSIYGIELQKSVDALEKVKIDGRFETFTLRGADYVIDYAHNGESLRSVLTSLREYGPKRLICLFGSVGGRTFGRRSEMGRVAAELCDLSVLTADNPDTEPPMEIIDDIAKSYSAGQEFVKIPDRAEAIKYALERAEAGDIVLFAGKGHETYQLIAGKRIPFCERDILLSELSKA